MNTNSIFFSYSRDNSEFVLNLAKQLRDTGAKVWLDQLDIKPGTRWDKSIEKALGESSTLLVVLSKSSVASHNVMDEVSYALEEGKKVVPVLFEECEIPFRLRRLQFADFTTSHEAGMATLTSALNSNTNTASATLENVKQAAPVAPVTPKETKPKPAAHKKEAAEMHTAKAPKSKKPLVYVGIAIIAVLAFYGIYAAVNGGAKDMMAMCKADWGALETAMTSGKEINELAELRKHIELYAPCPHEDEAMDRISFLKVIGSDPRTLNTDDTTEVAAEEAEEAKEAETTIETTDVNESLNSIEIPNTTDAIRSNESSSLNETGDRDAALSSIDMTDSISNGAAPPVVEAITGLNVKEVQYSSGDVSPAGYFTLIDGITWIENSLENESTATFTEVDRTINSVELFDEDRGYWIRLDLQNNTILLKTDASEEFSLFYTITETSSASG